MGVLSKWLHSEPPAQESAPVFSLVEVRHLALAAVEDCRTSHCERLRTGLSRAHDVRQLFLLRGEIYQAVAQAHCQFEAARRVNDLMPAFSGWVPDWELTRV